LIPTYRRVWAPRGKRPTASSRRKYQWKYLYSFVRPQTGETVHLIGSTVSSDAMSAVLRSFAMEAGLGPNRHAVVVLDGAGWHMAKDLIVPECIHLVFLPAYSPELQPAERLWPIINEGVANRTFAALEELVENLVSRCLYIDAEQKFVSGLTRFHWWPEEPSCTT
jgi:transposase